jgi:hypothetical protein
MAFTVNDFHDLVALLEERPEWRAELRRLILPEELLRLPDIVRELVDAVRELTEQMRRAEARLGRLETEVGDLKGNDLERRVRERPHIYLGKYARRTHLIGDSDLFALLDQAVSAGRIFRAQADDVERLDAVVEGQADDQKTYLAVEVSSRVDYYDFERAMRRAAALQQALQTPVRPIVVGTAIPDALRQRVESEGGGWVVVS